jgi:hypothetical protein
VWTSVGTLYSPSLSSAELLCHKCRAAEAAASQPWQRKDTELFCRFCLSDFAQTALSSSIRKLQTDTTV